MRACFLGQNVTALGYGVAILHTPRLPDPEPLPPKLKVDQDAKALPAEPRPAQRVPEPA